MYEHICIYVCICICMCIPTINQTNRFILYLLNTDDMNYTINTLSLCMYVLCMYVCCVRYRVMCVVSICFSGDYQKYGSDWDIVTDAAKDLLYRMLERDPTKRITTSEILAHPFFS